MNEHSKKLRKKIVKILAEGRDSEEIVDQIIKILLQQEECKHEWENCICKRCGICFVDKTPVRKYCSCGQEWVNHDNRKCNKSTIYEDTPIKQPAKVELPEEIRFYSMNDEIVVKTLNQIIEFLKEKER